MAFVKLVLIRHGESQWNSENRFTGWCDIDLSKKGITESKTVGKLLKKRGFIFDLAYTSLLKRAIHTLWNILDELDQSWLPVEKSWKLNERHYGILQGMNKNETVKKYGEKQVEQWRRSFSVIPPEITKLHKHYPGHDPRYTDLKKEELPLSESLELTFNRVVPFWEKKIFPQLIKGKRIIIVAHGNSLRALVKYLDHINEEEIVKVNIPNSIPLIYELNKNCNPIKHYFLQEDSNFDI